MKALGIVIGLALAGGVALAASKTAGAAPPVNNPPDNEPGDEPAEEPPIDEPVQEGPLPPAGSGTGEMVWTDPLGLGKSMVELLPLIPLDLQAGSEIHYAGIVRYSNLQLPFHSWVIDHSINGMQMYIFVSATAPNEWIAMFKHLDPPPSEPPFHFVLYRVSDTPSKNWMLENLAGYKPPFKS
jgi:hypothetical protein